jgi:hypothetical protein
LYGTSTAVFGSSHKPGRHYRAPDSYPGLFSFQHPALPVYGDLGTPSPLCATVPEKRGFEMPLRTIEQLKALLSTAKDEKNTAGCLDETATTGVGGRSVGRLLSGLGN